MATIIRASPSMPVPESKPSTDPCMRNSLKVQMRLTVPGCNLVNIMMISVVLRYSLFECKNRRALILLKGVVVGSLLLNSPSLLLP